MARVKKRILKKIQTKEGLKKLKAESQKKLSFKGGGKKSGGG